MVTWKKKTNEDEKTMRMKVLCIMWCNIQSQSRLGPITANTDFKHLWFWITKYPLPDLLACLPAGICFYVFVYQIHVPDTYRVSSDIGQIQGIAILTLYLLWETKSYLDIVRISFTESKQEGAYFRSNYGFLSQKLKMGGDSHWSLITPSMYRLNSLCVCLTLGVPPLLTGRAPRYRRLSHGETRCILGRGAAPGGHGAAQRLSRRSPRQLRWPRHTL